MFSMRKCKKCAGELSHKHHGLKCHPCRNEERKAEYHSKDQSARLAQCREYVKRNRKRIYARNRAYASRKRVDNPMLQSFYQARSRAKKKGIPFTIEYKDLPKAPARCPILGIQLAYNSSKRMFNSASIDKIKPELGYIIGNVAIISFRANFIKNDASVEELTKVLNFVRAHQ